MKHFYPFQLFLVTFSLIKISSAQFRPNRKLNSQFYSQLFADLNPTENVLIDLSPPENLINNYDDDENQQGIEYSSIDDQPQFNFNDGFGFDNEIYNPQNSGVRNPRRGGRIHSLCSSTTDFIDLNKLEPQFEHHPSHYKNITCEY